MNQQSQRNVQVPTKKEEIFFFFFFWQAKKTKSLNSFISETRPLIKKRALICDE